MEATELKPGARVVYTGTLCPRLSGEAGTFRCIGRNGWAEVDFDNFGDMKVAPANLVDEGTLETHLAMKFSGLI